jgi:hypothetical protein
MPSDLVQICEERARLLRDYSDAAGNYSGAVRALTELVFAGLEKQAAAARSKCRAAWEETEKSRLALSRHEADHHCDRGTQVPSPADGL